MAVDRKITTHLRIGVAQSSDKAGQALVQSLSQTVQLPLVEHQFLGEYDLLLVYGEKGLELRDQRVPRVNPVRATLTTRSWAISRRNPLGRALGRNCLRIVDATAGLGDDSYRFLRMGLDVTAIERVPVIFALLGDGFKRAGLTPRLRDRLSLIFGEACSVLPEVSPPPDVVYLDPMYPEKRKSSALARKELRLLRDLAGDDADALETFETAMRCARARVIVKRPNHAAPVAPHPVAQFSGKSVRYDVYSTRIQRGYTA